MTEIEQIISQYKAELRAETSAHGWTPLAMALEAMIRASEDYVKSLAVVQTT